MILRPFRQQQIALRLTGEPRSSADSGYRADSAGHGSCRGGPARLQHDGGFAPVSLPVTRHYLNREGVSDKFVAYIKSCASPELRARVKSITYKDAV